MKIFSTLFLLTAPIFAAQNDDFAQAHPSSCLACESTCPHCLGPAQKISNSPVRPYTCSGDWEITLAGLFWKPEMDGLEYAIEDDVKVELNIITSRLNNLINAEYKSPHSYWDFGFKLGLGYNFLCDGWDVGATWIHFKGLGTSHNEVESDENRALITLWSDYKNPRVVGTQNYASDIESNWGVDLNLVDVELGREYWLSKYLSMRPNIGLRFAQINQNLTLHHKGGIWSSSANPPSQDTIILNNTVQLNNDFKGTGPRSGIDLNWRLGCGWSMFNNLAASLIYGRFDIDHDESNRSANAPFSKFKVLESKDSFKASRGMLDLSLGIRWSGLFCDYKYGLAADLGWEHHVFFHQNQLWKVSKIDAISDGALPRPVTTLGQTRGTLSTGGLTLSVQFDF